MNHDWSRYNPATACIEHVMFEDVGGEVIVKLEVFEEILTALKFEKGKFPDGQGKQVRPGD